MGSIGDAFPYPAPIIGSADWPNWILCMDELIDRVSSPVPLSSIEGGDLDMDNNSIINIKDLQFIDNDEPAIPGTIGYHDDEWWLVTNDGAIQITNNGALDITLNGGIGGDYGGGNPASVRFVDADLRYDFYDHFANGAWAYGRFRGVDIAGGATSAVRARLQYSGVGNLTFDLPATLPGLNVSVLQINSSGTIDHNASGTPLTNNIYLGNTEVKHTLERKIGYTFNADLVTSGVYTTATTAGFYVISTTAGTAIFRVDGIQVGWRIKAVKVRTFKQGTNVTTVTMFKANNGAPGSIATTTDTTAGNRRLTATVGAPAATVEEDQYTVLVDTGDNNDEVSSVVVYYDIP